MNLRKLNRKLARMGRPAVNDTPAINPFTQNLWQRPDGKWVIISDGDRGKTSYRKGPEKPGGGADILTFDTKDAVCDYLWERAIRPRPPVEPDGYTPEERAALQKQLYVDFLASELEHSAFSHDPWRATMQPYDEFFSREDRFSLGIDEISGRHFVSFPVTIGVADYSEYYVLDDDTYRAWLADPALAIPFVEECRNREHDDLLLQQPGWNRGIPI